MQIVKVGNVYDIKEFEKHLNGWLQNHQGWRIDAIYPLPRSGYASPLVAIVYEGAAVEEAEEEEKHKIQDDQREEDS